MPATDPFVGSLTQSISMLKENPEPQAEPSEAVPPTNADTKKPPLCQWCSKDPSDAVVYCDDCERFLCAFHRNDHLSGRKLCKHVLVPVEVHLVGGESTAAAPPLVVRMCPTHPQCPLDTYCRDCGLAMCAYCFNMNHSTHTAAKPVTVAEEQKEKPNEWDRRLAAQDTRMSDTLECIDHTSGAVRSEAEKLWSSANRQYDEASARLEESRREMLEVHKYFSCEF